MSTNRLKAPIDNAEPVNYIERLKYGGKRILNGKSQDKNKVGSQ